MKHIFERALSWALNISKVEAVSVAVAMVVATCAGATSTDLVQVHTAIHPIIVKEGGKAQFVVELQIAQGCHINSHDPADHSLIPTTLTVAPAAGIKGGHTLYPGDTYVMTGFSPVPLNVYDGDVEIKVPLEVGSQLRDGQASVSASLRFQACNDRMCFPPQTLQLSQKFTVTHRREGH